MRRYIFFAIPAVVLWLFVTGCYTKLYRSGINGTQDTYSNDILYDRYDSSAIDTSLTKDDVFPDTYPTGYDYYNYYDRWDTWGRYRPRTRWGFDFYSYSPPYYSGYYGWEDYYGYPWWYSWDRGYWHGGGGTPGTPGEPPSKRPVGRRDESPQNPPPSSVEPTRPPPVSHVDTPSSSTPSRPAQQKSENKQRDFGRRKR